MTRITTHPSDLSFCKTPLLSKSWVLSGEPRPPSSSPCAPRDPRGTRGGCLRLRVLGPCSGPATAYSPISSNLDSTLTSCSRLCSSRHINLHCLMSFYPRALSFFPHFRHSDLLLSPMSVSVFFYRRFMGFPVFIDIGSPSMTGILLLYYGLFYGSSGGWVSLPAGAIGVRARKF